MSLEAFVTLATNDGYALGALVLGESIRKVGTERQLVIMISNHLSDLIRKTLETCFDEIVVVEELDSNDTKNLNLLSRPELGITFTKINCWLLEKYSKCVFLDSDCVVLRNIDDLFQREEFSAAPDAGWPDCFNSGVFVFQPSKQTFTKLVQFANQQDASFDGGDQGLLNRFFSNWRTEDISRHLPFTYNVTANAFYSYLPAVTRFRNDIHIVHFAGALKPWQLSYNPQSEQLSGNLGGHSEIQREFFLSWWRIMYQRVWPHLSNDNQEAISNNQSGFIGEGQFGGQTSTGSLNYGSLTSSQGLQTGSAAHRRAWEAGHVDYYGRDSFSNIQQQLERNMAQQQQPYHPSQTRQTTPDNTTTQLKSSLKQTTPPPPQLQQTTNISQNLVEQITTTTAVITTNLKTSSNDTIPPVPQQQTTTVTTTTGPKTLLNQTTPETTTVTTTTRPKTVLNEATSQQQTTTLPKTVLNEATPAPQETATAALPKTLLKETTQQQTTAALPKTVLNEATPASQQQTTAAQPKTVLNEAKPIQQETATAALSKTLLKETTQQTTTTTTTLPKTLLKEATTASQQQTTTLPKTLLNESTSQQETTTTTTALPKTLLKESTQQQTTTLPKTSLKEVTPVKEQTANVVKSSVKETSLAHPTSSVSSNHLLSSNGSSLPTETTSSTNEHETNWKVKSTIVTSYTQGVGPTVVSKTVTESSASSSNDTPTVTTIKENTDPRHFSGLNVTAKTSNDHFAWFFDKVFIAITYTISLCYLVFLVTLRRSKNTDNNHDTVTSVHGATTSNVNRVNK